MTDEQIEVYLKNCLNSKVFEWHKIYKENSNNSNWIEYICAVLTSEYQYEMISIFSVPQ